MTRCINLSQVPQDGKPQVYACGKTNRVVKGWLIKTKITTNFAFHLIKLMDGSHTIIRD